MTALKNTINLDAARAARREAAADHITIEFNGSTYTCPTELPYAVLRAVKADDLDGALVALLGQKQADKLLADSTLTLQDINALLEGIVESGSGAPLGEASGSSRS